jgi:hypothetical protein
MMPAATQDLLGTLSDKIKIINESLKLVTDWKLKVDCIEFKGNIITLSINAAKQDLSTQLDVVVAVETMVHTVSLFLDNPQLLIPITPLLESRGWIPQWRVDYEVDHLTGYLLVRTDSNLGDSIQNMLTHYEHVLYTINKLRQLSNELKEVFNTL